MPFSRIRAGISGAASASVDPTRLGASRLLPASVGLMACLADVAVDLPAGVESLLFFGGQRAGAARPRPACRAIRCAPGRWRRARRDRRPPPQARTARRVRGSTARSRCPASTGRSCRRHGANAYAPPGPARPPGHVGHGAFATGGAPRRPAVPGIGALRTATSAPRSSADRCQRSCRLSSAIEASTFWIAASCPPRTIVAASIVIAVSRCGVCVAALQQLLEHDAASLPRRPLSAASTTTGSTACRSSIAAAAIRAARPAARRATRQAAREPTSRYRPVSSSTAAAIGMVRRHRASARQSGSPTTRTSRDGSSSAFMTVAGSMASRPSSVHSACSFVARIGRALSQLHQRRHDRLRIPLDQQPLRRVAPPAVRVRQRLDELRRRRCRERVHGVALRRLVHDAIDAAQARPARRACATGCDRADTWSSTPGPESRRDTCRRRRARRRARWRCRPAGSARRSTPGTRRSRTPSAP